MRQPHLSIGNVPVSKNFKGHQAKGGTKPAFPVRNREQHGARLLSALDEAWSEAQRRAAHARIAVSRSASGIYVQVEGPADGVLKLDSLDLESIEVDLRSVRTVRTVGGVHQIATVYVPSHRFGDFRKKFELYLTEDHPTYGTPKNDALARSINDLRFAELEGLWTDDRPFPEDPDTPQWWEIWISGEDASEVLAIIDELEIIRRQSELVFVDRSVIMVLASVSQLAELLGITDDLAELRAPTNLAGWFKSLSNAEQRDWAADLSDRVQILSNDISVCVLDTGLTHTHPVLATVVTESDCQVVAGLPISDRDGHGSLMAGLAAFGPLEDALAGAHPIEQRHVVESVKIIDRAYAHDPELYGWVTSRAVALAEIENPDRARTFALAVTDDTVATDGHSTSWSATIDALAFGADNEEGDSRLFVVSAGNTPEDTLSRYPGSIDLSPIQDPAQAWNALTVGYFTNKDAISEAGREGWTPVAAAGHIGPLSTSSLLWEDKASPIKPEIVMEGGNWAASADRASFDAPGSLQVLSTSHQPNIRHFNFIGETSAATAQVARFAAELMAALPGLWPETYRALVVHSARWTEAMASEVGNANGMDARRRCLRRFGWGVPDLERAVWSSSSDVTLVAQAELSPFGGHREMGEMHLYDLPWPVEALTALGEREVRLRVSLSYFIEPNPARRGNIGKYRYASHQLNFDFIRPGESMDDFGNRVNAAWESGENAAGPSIDDQWLLGQRGRTRGSIRQDIWTGSAVDLASRGRLAVVPVIGWWRELKRQGKWNETARYSIVASIDAGDESIDLYTEIAANIEIATPIEVST